MCSGICEYVMGSSMKMNWYSSYPRIPSSLAEQTDVMPILPQGVLREGRCGFGLRSAQGSSTQNSLASSQTDISDVGRMFFRYPNSVFWSRSTKQPGRLLLKADLNVQSSICYICVAAFPVLGIHLKYIFRMVVMVTQQHKCS